MNNIDEYRYAVTNALAGFQLIEESLKGYIEFYHETVRRFLPEEIAYDYSRKDVQDAALGKLTNVFSKITKNRQLISDLRSLQRMRDELAHTALIELFGSPPSSPFFEHKTSELVELGQRLSSILGQINKASIDLLLVAEVKANTRKPN